MNPRQASDELLMSQVARGQRASLEPLVRRYASPLLTFIRRLVGDAHRSEELFQEAFLAVWCKRHQYDAARPFKPWLYGIALNQCRAAGRRRAGPLLGMDDPDDLSLPALSAPSPAETMIATETAEQVATAVTCLPLAQRTVVVLRVWEGLSYAEIAEVLDAPEGTVRSQMHHALKKLRVLLQPYLT